MRLCAVPAHGQVEAPGRTPSHPSVTPAGPKRPLHVPTRSRPGCNPSSQTITSPRKMIQEPGRPHAIVCCTGPWTGLGQHHGHSNQAGLPQVHYDSAPPPQGTQKASTRHPHGTQKAFTRHPQGPTCTPPSQSLHSPKLLYSPPLVQ